MKDPARHSDYRFFNKRGVLIYVGCSWNICARLRRHSSTAKWYEDISTIKIKHYPDKSSALEAERRLISKLSPPHNLICTELYKARLRRIRKQAKGQPVPKVWLPK